MKADKEATAARRFKDPKSYVTPDGREILKGEDWRDRVFALTQRSRGQCEYQIDWYEAATNTVSKTRCLRDAVDPHHRTLRSVKRTDTLEGLLHVCRHHHQVLDKQQRQAKRSTKNLITKEG
jgi:hypothetical protein